MNDINKLKDINYDDLLNSYNTTLDFINYLEKIYEELKKEVAEYKAFAVASTRRVITNEESKKENSDDKLQEIVKEYKGRYERWH